MKLGPVGSIALALIEKSSSSSTDTMVVSVQEGKTNRLGVLGHRQSEDNMLKPTFYQFDSCGAYLRQVCFARVKPSEWRDERHRQGRVRTRIKILSQMTFFVEKRGVL